MKPKIQNAHLFLLNASGAISRRAFDNESAKKRLTPLHDALQVKNDANDKLRSSPRLRIGEETDGATNPHC